MSNKYTEADIKTGLEIAGFVWTLDCFAHIEMDDVQAKRLAIQIAEEIANTRLGVAKLFCKDCGSGRALSLSTMAGGTPRWFHLTGPASGRECAAAVMWGPTS